ncbi:10954_t:CDS:2 [Acaulospora morrowiae]|uniref:10954_t:CDS:1 n=1 Tax=Acaulospora morrowiae TaxID=94023 RepID=A0A9N8VS04_9GLOM|nr:10954_t:CDS:2 [Acaulospora morrowiae]
MSEEYKLEESNGIGEWKKLYEKVLGFFKIEFKTESLRTPVQILESDLVVDLKKLETLDKYFENKDTKKPETLDEYLKSEASKTKARIIRIYGDVVQLSDDLKLPTLENGSVILIAARRIEIKPGCKIIIDCKENKTFRLVAYAMEMPSKFDIVTSDDRQFEFKIREEYKGRLLSLPIGEFIDIPTFDSIILEKEPFVKILRYSLQIASALFYDDRNVTKSILTWIVEITKSEIGEMKEETKETDDESESHKKVREMYNQAHLLLKQLNILEEREKNKILFVPLLNVDFYKNYVNEFEVVAESYGKEYYRIMGNKHENLEKQAEFTRLLEDCCKMTDMYRRLKDRADDRYKKAHVIMETMKKKLMDKKDAVLKASDEFRIGIEEWKENKELEARTKMVIAVFELAISVGKVVIQPGGIAAFVENIEKTCKSIQEALIAADNMEKLIKTLGDIKDDENVKNVVDVGNKANEINVIKNQLEKNYEDYKSLNDKDEERRKKIESLDADEFAERLKDMDQRGILTKVEWRLIKKSVEDLLKYPIEQKIKGANEYLNRLDELFIFIESFIKANIEERESDNEKFKIELQVQTSESQEKGLQNAINRRELKEDDYENIGLFLFEKLINIKCWMMAYLEKYRCAYHYWSLSESKITLSVMKTISEHKKDQLDIYKDLEDTYSKYRNPIQSSKHPFILPKELVEKFKVNKSVTYEIPLDHEEFKNSERVRLHTFRVFLRGIGNENGNDKISFWISNTDIFYDKDYEGNKYVFEAENTGKLRFRYKINEEDKPLTDAVFDESVYFAPTPFSHWTIELGDDKCDLSELKSIEIELEVKCHFFKF